MMLLEQDAGSSLNPTVANIIIGAVQVKRKRQRKATANHQIMEKKIECDANQIVATLLAALVMDRAGRRLLLNTSALLMVSKISIIDLIMSICPHLRIVLGRLKNPTAFIAQVISIGLLGFYFYAADHMKHLAEHITFVSPCLHQNPLQSDQINLETISRQFDAQVPVISLSVFVFGFSLGFGPIPWLMMSELFAPEVG